jgi:hypothetical protein
MSDKGLPKVCADRPETESREAPRDVCGGRIVAGRPRTAPFQCITREIGDVGPNGARVGAVESRWGSAGPGDVRCAGEEGE